MANGSITPRRALRYIVAYLSYQTKLIAMTPPRMLTVALSVLGIFSAASDLIEKTGAATGGAIAFLLLLLYAYLIVRSQKAWGGEDPFADFRYHATIPATPNQLKRITEACAIFGDSDIDPADGCNAVEDDVFSTVAVRDYRGREVGFADYYCFEKEDALAYVNGRIRKKDFFADYFLKHPQARSAGAIYISTIYRYDFISDRSAFGAKETAVLAHCLIRLIASVQKEPDDGWLIFASAGSKSGERLIRHFRLEETGITDSDGNMIFLKDNVTRAQLLNSLRNHSYLAEMVNFAVVGYSTEAPP